MKTAQIPTKKAERQRAGRPAGVGKTVFMDDVHLHVPGWVTDVDSFRKWTDTDDFPDRGNIWWLAGEVWADMSKERLFSHLAVKQEFFRVLGNLAKSDCPGMVIPDGLLLSNFAAEISGNPDATYISAETLDSDRVRLIEGTKGGWVEVQGTPDMVLEVVSDSSVDKDLVTLMTGYWEAGIPEYWVVDARSDEPRFDIFRHGSRAYKKSSRRAGWVTSHVFRKAFQLRVARDKARHPTYTLDVR